MSDYDFLPVSSGGGDAALMHIQTDRLTGSTLIDVDTVVNIPSKFIGTSGTLLPTGFINPATKKDMKCHVSGADIIIDAFEPGSTDTGNTAGQVLIVKPNTGWANRVAAFIKNATGFGTPEPVTLGNTTITGTLGVSGLFTPTGGFSMLTALNPCKFSVYWNAGQPSYLAVAGFPYIMKFDTKNFDTGNDFNTSTFLFTAPVNGFYLFEYGVSANNGSSANGWVNSALVKNGSVILVQTQNPAQVTQPNTFSSASKLVHLTAGDTMQVNDACSIGGIGMDGGDSVTYFSGFLVSAT